MVKDLHKGVFTIFTFVVYYQGDKINEREQHATEFDSWICVTLCSLRVHTFLIRYSIRCIFSDLIYRLYFEQCCIKLFCVTNMFMRVLCLKSLCVKLQSSFQGKIKTLYIVVKLGETDVYLNKTLAMRGSLIISWRFQLIINTCIRNE